MERSEAQQRQFVLFGRPSAFAVSFVGFGIAALFSESRALDRFLIVLGVATLITQVPAWVAVARGVPVTRVARAVLLADIPMVAAMSAALDNENLLVVAFFAPVAFSALMIGALFTVVLTALAFAAVLVVGIVFVEADAITILADLVVLSVTGGILAGLSRETHAAQTELARDRIADVAALHMAAERAARGLEFPPGRMVALEIPAGQIAPADPERMLQVFSNLLANALRHGEGGIVVSSRADGAGLEISVSDGGLGVPLDQVAELFQPFARGSEGVGGTGLGLPIARALVEAHGRTLEYRPQDDGLPHAFVISLPAPAEAARREAALGSKGSLKVVRLSARGGASHA